MPNYDINYNDERFTKVESEKSAALSDLEKTYAGMINESDKYYQAQIDASKDWADKQTQLQNDKTDQAIKEINQQKEQTKKDYLKEQSGAYVDWQKQSNEYGAEAENMAASGLHNTGFSESSQVSMYNTYQNRVATARESYNLAVQNYNNSITQARLQNSSVLAEIAYEALQQQLELSLQGFQYKNTLVLEKADKKTELEQMYHERYQDVLNQINTENSLAEQVRQYNESLALEKAQFEWQKEQAKKASSSGGGGSSGGYIKKSSSSNKISTPNTITKAVNKDDASSSSDTKKQNKSVLELGYGPISAQNLANKIASGEVETYQDKSGTTLVKKKKTSILKGLGSWKG